MRCEDGFAGDCAARSLGEFGADNAHRSSLLKCLGLGEPDRCNLRIGKDDAGHSELVGKIGDVATENGIDGDAQPSWTKPGSVRDDCLIKAARAASTLKVMSSSPTLA